MRANNEETRRSAVGSAPDGLDFVHGGRHTHGHRLNLPQDARSFPNSVRKDPETTNYDEVEQGALRSSQTIIIDGSTLIRASLILPVIRQIADKAAPGYINIGASGAQVEYSRSLSKLTFHGVLLENRSSSYVKLGRYYSFMKTGLQDFAWMLTDICRSVAAPICFCKHVRRFSRYRPLDRRETPLHLPRPDRRHCDPAR